MAVMFPVASSLFQEDNTPCCTENIIREGFEEHEDELHIIYRFHRSQHLLDVFDWQIQTL